MDATLVSAEDEAPKAAGTRRTLTEEAQGVEASTGVVHNLLEERVGLPLFSPEGHGDGLAEVVELQAAGCHGVHDGGVVDDADLDAHVQGAEGEVSVRGGAASMGGAGRGGAVGSSEPAGKAACAS